MFKKILSFVLSATLLSTMTLNLCFNASAVDGNSEDFYPIKVIDEFIPSTATIEDDFEDDVVLVSIKHQYSVMNQVWAAEDFGVDNIDYIRDLTYSDWTEKEKQEYFTTRAVFRQILAVYLAEPGKENVLKMINDIESQEIVELRRVSVSFYLDIPDNNYQAPASVENFGPKLAPPEGYSNLNSEAYKMMGVAEAQNYARGDGVTVGVIDGKVGAHEAISINGTEYFSDPLNSNNDFHGTEMASIIAGSTTGVAPDAKIQSLVVDLYTPNNTTATVNAISRAVEFAQNNNLKILNCSYGWGTLGDPQEEAMSRFSGLIVCAAGNSGYDNGYIPHYPSNYTLDNIISVACCDTQGNNIYNYGEETVDLAAPSFAQYYVISVYTNGAIDYHERRSEVSGEHQNGMTSTATAMVSGVAALLLSYNPNLTTEQLKEAIMYSAQQNQYPDLLGKTVTGGVVNAMSALEYIKINYMPSVTFTPPNPEDVFEYEVTVDGVTYTENIKTDGGKVTVPTAESGRGTFTADVYKITDGERKFLFQFERHRSGAHQNVTIGESHYIYYAEVTSPYNNIYKVSINAEEAYKIRLKAGKNPFGGKDPVAVVNYYRGGHGETLRLEQGFDVFVPKNPDSYGASVDIRNWDSSGITNSIYRIPDIVEGNENEFGLHYYGNIGDENSKVNHRGSNDGRNKPFEIVAVKEGDNINVAVSFYEYGDIDQNEKHTLYDLLNIVMHLEGKLDFSTLGVGSASFDIDSLFLEEDLVVNSRNIETYDSSINGSGEITVHEETDENDVTPLMFNVMAEDYFASKNIPHVESYQQNDMNININNPIISDSTLKLYGNVALNSDLMADGDIVISRGDVISGGNFHASENIIYSRNGNITVDADNMSFNGIIYAPNGTVTVEANNVTMNGRIIAKDLVITAETASLKPSLQMETSKIYARMSEAVKYAETAVFSSFTHILANLDGDWDVDHMDVTYIGRILLEDAEIKYN